MEKKLADLHVVLQADNGAERILGATVVLKNASQVNMRYYTAAVSYTHLDVYKRQVEEYPLYSNQTF